ncbi:hypothetical protein CALCODRAFT_494884 [Calocera cornea HHB12733]|uniref:Phosphatases II n=1 Tax=Calocera cornea HHB12733 TaxID=1353952 RepID=A0A165GS12_9BASI|nr:hypothetical protein CALCODRAFT_494884 [Calocera cornea HHB12733]
MPMPPSPPLALALSLPALTLSPHSAGPAPSQLPTHPHLSPSTSTSTQPPAPPPSSTTLLATNPFYDNIRQHLELAQGVTGSPFEPLVLPRRVRHWHGWHTGLMPRWLADVVRRSELPPAEEEEEGATPGDLQQAQQPQHSQHAQHSQQPQPQLPQRQGRGSSPPRWPASPPRNGSPRATPPSAGSGAPGTPAAERERERGVDLAPPRSPARLGAAPSSTVPASAASPHPALASRSPSHAKPDGGEALAMQFYKVELGEQRRLMGVMEHHSRETFVVPHQPGAGAAAGVGVGVGGGPATPGPGLGEFGFGVGFANADPNASVQITAPAAVSAQPREYDVDRTPWQDGEAREGQGKDEFPFSITAGIEKGALNRYRNIWPFAHTRVRLPQGTASDGSDYVNASFVHPRGTRRRYVCAQGPLEATRGDFWNLVWDQNITTIIMLTKQTEAGLSKCFPYWTAPMAGPFRLRHISTTGGEDDPSASAGFFDLHGAAAAGHEEPGAIRRVFALSRDGAGERIVTQLQMVSWPDWEVPRSPRCLLDLIRQTNALRAASPRPNAPVLVHCSAGVGRTGSFVLIDAVLDALRSELLATKARIERGERARSPPHDPMHVDTIAGSGTGTTSASPSLSSLSLSLASHYQSSLDSAPTSRSASNSPSPGSHAPLGAKPTLAGRAGSLLPSTEANPQSSQNTFDYKMPRSALARDQPSRTPTPLSELEPDPIQKVLEDMREQRMSLCQSLNQYVFCHRAICEGAIELAEEILGPSDHSASPGMLPGPSTASPSAMDIEPATSGFFPKPTLSIPLHLPHSKRAASKSPEEVERVLSLTPDDLHSRNGSPRPALDGIGHKPSLKRQMTRRGDVQSGSASPSQR